MSEPQTKKRIIDHSLIRDNLNSVFEENFHAKWILSLANATQGALVSGSLTIHAIGHGWAVAQGTSSKHSIKQVNRLLSNDKIILEDFFHHWVRYQVSNKTDVYIVMDWSDFARDDQTTLSLQLVTQHGRSSSLLWKTYRKSTLKEHQREYEMELLALLQKNMPDDGCLSDFNWWPRVCFTNNFLISLKTLTTSNLHPY